MIEGGKGGYLTNLTGLKFEKDTSMLTNISNIDGYEIDIVSSTKSGYKKANILYGGKLVAKCYRQHGFYDLLKENGINWKDIVSKKLLPDDTIFVIMRDTFFIIECKFQKVSGSVDEKLQTCDFKKKQYQKLLKPLNLKVEYVYILSEWFKKSEYQDVLDYIDSVNCHYRFNEIPLSWFGLPC